jgi:hypothetical protein
MHVSVGVKSACMSDCGFSGWFCLDVTFVRSFSWYIMTPSQGDLLDIISLQAITSLSALVGTRHPHLPQYFNRKIKSLHRHFGLGFFPPYGSILTHKHSSAHWSLCSSRCGRASSQRDTVCALTKYSFFYNNLRFGKVPLHCSFLVAISVFIFSANPQHGKPQDSENMEIIRSTEAQAP